MSKITLVVFSRSKMLALVFDGGDDLLNQNPMQRWDQSLRHWDPRTRKINQQTLSSILRDFCVW